MQETVSKFFLKQESSSVSLYINEVCELIKNETLQSNHDELKKFVFENDLLRTFLTKSYTLYDTNIPELDEDKLFLQMCCIATAQKNTLFRSEKNKIKLMMDFFVEKYIDVIKRRPILPKAASLFDPSIQANSEQLSQLEQDAFILNNNRESKISLTGAFPLKSTLIVKWETLYENYYQDDILTNQSSDFDGICEKLYEIYDFAKLEKKTMQQALYTIFKKHGTQSVTPTIERKTKRYMQEMYDNTKSFDNEFDYFYHLFFAFVLSEPPIELYHSPQNINNDVEFIDLQPPKDEVLNNFNTRIVFPALKTQGDSSQPEFLTKLKAIYISTTT